MKNRQVDEKKIEELEELLQKTREREAPLWLKQEIMHRVYKSNPSLLHRLMSRFFQPPALRLSPVGLVLVLLIAVTGFWGGILAERHSSDVNSPRALTMSAFADNAGANYLIGRGLLAGNQREAALDFFRKAVELEPDTAEYVHWQGVAYWSLGKDDLERQSYYQTVQNHPDFVPSLVNLGHNYLESGDYNAALQYYERALQNDPHISEALYNSALAYQKLDNEAMERQAFRDYLETNRTGKWAYRAVDHLHQLGDFTFRSYRIGIHRIILNVTDLLQPDSVVRQKEVELLAHAVNRASRHELHIVVYNKEKNGMAGKTALNLRNQLLRQLGSEQDHPIKVSWFEAAETVSSQNGENLQLSPSVLIFSTLSNGENRRKSI
jgi:tetratricopeptide (TPR) repeat protein